ncbi:hypothetical protein Dsin_000879 [Dipteronia sinensis]|uniref:MADS-box domain-containing protein n=1 Tax=Dipteronia sinensis TaxID=43782 RepID=A0AAE0EHU3_9ROSI|nr:hypothetical protein Dsin_000879 [Dipteronia sinensis]
MEKMIKKPCMGRQKISIVKISKKNHLQVTFSKRRTGLFKKASELATLCGVEIGIIVFSPANKAFSFGHLDVESIIDRFLSRNPQPDSGANRLIKAHRNANIHELNMELTQVLSQLEVERKRGEALDKMRKASRKQCWWESPIAELGSRELEQLRMALEELKKKVAEQANKIFVESNNTSFFKVNAYENKTKPHDQSSVASSSMYKYWLV